MGAVEGSCATKPVEVCEEMTRFQEEFVDEDRCRDIPIKDCKNVQSEVCSEQQELVCEPQQSENCEIIPHEECEHIVEKIPKNVSKKITKVVCDEGEEEKEEPTEIAEEESSNNDVSIINDIFEIFGISNNDENEIEDEKPKLIPVTTTTTEFMIDNQDSNHIDNCSYYNHNNNNNNIVNHHDIETSTVTDFENIPSETVPTDERRMDESKIIFSDSELDARNKDLANRVYLNVVPTRPTSTETLPRTSEDPHSRIFFPQ